MTLLSPVALCALVLLVGLVILHARRQRHRRLRVPSLLVWQQLAEEASPSRLRSLVPVLPLLLALQLVAVGALILSLARPVHDATASGPALRTFVIDDSLAMTGTDLAPDRLAAAKRLVAAELRRLRRSTPVQIIASGGEPRVLYAGADAAGARRALAALGSSDGPPQLGAAMELAAGRAPAGPLEVVHALGDPVPRGWPAATQRTIGRRDDDQSVSASARCGGGGRCMVLAVARNTSRQPVSETLSMSDSAGRRLAAGRVRVPPSASVGVLFTVAASAGAVELRLPRADPIPADDEAWVTLPVTRPASVALVGRRPAVTPVAQALRSVPGVRLSVAAPGTATHGTLHPADLTVFDGWTPPSLDAAAGTVMLIDPPRLPGGRVGRPLGQTAVTWTDAASPLLAGVDLGPLVLPAGSAHALRLPEAVSPLLSTAAGPLIGAGAVRGRRLIVWGLDPERAGLTSIDAFPLLLANVVADATRWLPPELAAGVPAAVQVSPGVRSLTVTPVGAAAGTTHKVPSPGVASLTVARPGLYTVAERGGANPRRRTVAVDAVMMGGAAQPAPARPPRTPSPATRASRTSWWPWAVLLAIVAMAAELAYVARLGPREEAA